MHGLASIFLSAIFAVFLFFSERCNDNTTYTAYKPLFMQRTDLENSIKFESPRDLYRPSKIYHKDNFIFISEAYKGVHIIDNTNPAQPQKIAFIKVVGCLDMAIRQSTIYVDNAIDLVAIDLSDPQAPKVVSRVPEVFQEPEPPDQLTIPVQYNKENRPPGLVLVDWEKE